MGRRPSSFSTETGDDLPNETLEEMAGFLSEGQLENLNRLAEMSNEAAASLISV